MTEQQEHALANPFVEVTTLPRLAFRVYPGLGMAAALSVNL